MNNNFNRKRQCPNCNYLFLTKYRDKNRTVFYLIYKKNKLKNENTYNENEVYQCMLNHAKNIKL
ncbi:hypothetical protein UT300001_35220 [Clostridium sp. CTA-1]